MGRPAGVKNKTSEERGLLTGKCPPVTSLIGLLKAGVSQNEIAVMYNVAPYTVNYQLKKHGISVKDLRVWQERKADVLSHVQMKVINSMTDKKIADASLRHQATTFNILHNAERLERGQSTSNVSLQALMENQAEMDKQILKLETELGIKDAEVETVAVS